MKAFLCILAAIVAPVESFSQLSLLGRKISNKSRLTLAHQHDDGGGTISIALTREDGKNGKLLKAIQQHEMLSSHVTPFELPCIAHADGPDYPRLKTILEENDFDYLTITSPEAARVLALALEGSKVPPIAAVGKATEATLREFGLQVAFVPTKATAETLVQELPSTGSSTRVLYPASARAKDTLQNGLQARGFEVTRLNTYDTVTSTWEPSQVELANQCAIACFASPSSIKGWLENTGENKSVLCACIGETSAEACRKQGWPEDSIFFPDQPGIEGWVKAIEDALETLRVAT
jgi:uroporphyrinogen-III synthase